MPEDKGSKPIEKRVVRVLVIEDNAGDIYLMQRFFGEQSTGEVQFELEVANDGEKALDHLFRSINGEEDGIEMPHLIILDLNLPKVNGKELLYRIKQHDRLRKVPVVIFSSSTAPSDIIGSYNMHANSYVVKPYNLEDFSTAVASICNFWTNTASLPG